MQAPNFAVTIVSAPRRFSECLICWTNIQVFSQLLCWLWPGICPPGIHFQVILHVYIILFSTEGTLNMWYFAQFGKPAILLKVTILHGCFSRFLNFTIGTKLRNASHTQINYLHLQNIQLTFTCTKSTEETLKKGVKYI